MHRYLAIRPLGAGWLPYAVVFLLIGVNWAALMPLSIFPFIDLPNHLAEATVHKYAETPGSPLTKFFRDEVSPFKPNVAHIVFCSMFPSVELGNRLFYALYIAAVPLLMALLIRASGGDDWMAILSFTLLWSHSVIWGFVGSTAGIPALLLYLLLYIRFADRGSFQSAAWLSLIFVLLYWSHVLFLLFAILHFVVMEALHWKYDTAPYRCYRLLPLVPVAVLVATWLITGREFAQSSTVGFLATYYRDEYLFARPALFIKRLALFFTFGQMRLAVWPYGSLIGSSFAVALFLPLLCGLRKQSLPSLFNSNARRAILGFTLCGLGCYLVLPDRLPGQWDLYERYAVLVMLGVVCIGSWLVSGRWRTVVRVGAVCVAATYCGLCGQYFWEFNRFTRLLDGLPQGRVPGHTNGCRNHRRQRIPGHAGVDSFQQLPDHLEPRASHYACRGLPFCAIRRRATEQELPRYEEWIRQDTNFRDLLRRYQRCAYLLTHGTRPYEAVIAGNRYVLARAADGWALFRSKNAEQPGQGAPKDRRLPSDQRS